jgi:hypothetical protein
MLGCVAPFLLATVALTAPQPAQVPAAAAAPKPADQDVESSERRLVELLTDAQAAVRGFEAEFEETTQAEMTESPTAQTVRWETTVTGKLVCGARFCVIEPTGGERVGLMDEHGQAIRRPGEVVRSEVATLPIQGVAGLRIDPNGLRGFGLGAPFPIGRTSRSPRIRRPAR